MRARAALRSVPFVYALAGLVVAGIYLRTSSNEIKAVGLSVLSAASVGAVGYGLARNRPAHRLVWLLVGALQATWTVGWIFWESHIVATGAPPSPNSLVNLIFLCGYPLAVGAVLFAMRRREGDVIGFLDAGIVAAALFVPAWGVFLHGFVDDPGLTFDGRVNQIAYGVCDIAVLAAVLRALVTSGRRSASYWFLLAGAALLVASDFVWNWSTRLGEYTPGGWADLGWVLSPILFGLAALIPSMADLDADELDAPRRMRLDRFGLLLVAALVAPVGAIIEVIEGNTEVHRLAPMLGASIVVVMLILSRLGLILRDEARLAEELARRNEALLDAEALTGLGHWQWDIASGAVAWSEQLFRIFRLDPGEFTPTFEGFLGCVHPDDRAFVKHSVETALATGQMLEYDARIVRSDGELGHISTTGRLVTDRLGVPVQMLGTALDITERKASELRLAQQARILATTGDAVLATDLDPTITAWNKGAERLFGWREEEIVGKPLSVFVPEELATEQAARRVAALRGESVVGYESLRLHKDGRRIPVAVTLSGILDDAGRTVGVSAIVRDITARQKLEAWALALEQNARIESERAREILLEQNERLRELDRMKDDFVASVSHELRTPLTSIRGYLELVREGEAGELTDEAKHFLSVVDRNADRLQRVVGDLLFVAQVDAGRIALERRPVDLRALAEETIEAARPGAEAKDVLLDLDTDGVSELEADRARLSQVLENLVSNAVRFTPAGGTVGLRAFAENGVVVVEVSDTGTGISPEDQKRLFERFFRTAQATTEAIQGTGLGLAIVKAIVDAHGGRIAVDSEVGRGTTFRVELPAAVRERAIA